MLCYHMFQNVMYTIPNLIVDIKPSSPYFIGTFKLTVMKDLRIDIECILANDSVNLTKIQAKINQWITKGELVKYEIHTTNTHIVFNICRKKSA